MLEDLAPSNQKYSDDPAMQELCAHTERWIIKIGLSLHAQMADGKIASLAALQDFAWDALQDFVVPVEASARDRLKRSGTGLPWESRLDIGLYWRLMYAAHVEAMADRHALARETDALKRPIRHALSAMTLLVGQLAKPRGGTDPHFLQAMRAPGATPIGHALYHGIVERAGYQIGLRGGLRPAAKPIELGTRVRAGNVLAELTGYGFDGSVTLSRETEPAERAGLAWMLCVADGRWQAVAWPWQIALAV